MIIYSEFQLFRVTCLPTERASKPTEHTTDIPEVAPKELIWILETA